MVFAGAELEEAIGSHPSVAAGGGAVQPHPLGVQVVDPHQTRVGGGLKGFPRLVLTQSSEDIGQAVIAEIQGAHWLTDAGLQGLEKLSDGGLNVAEPVVALGEDVGQPDSSDPTQAEAAPVAVGGEEVV